MWNVDGLRLGLNFLVTPLTRPPPLRSSESPVATSRKENKLSIKAALLLYMLVAGRQPCRGQIQVLSITSSANFVPGLLQPGSLASIFCTGLQDISGLIVAQGYPLPRTLAGVKVTVNGIDAPILAIAEIAGRSYQQINLQIPWETKFTSGLAFEVSQKSAAARITTYLYAPWHYRPVTKSDPARPEEWIVVYATNLGSVQNQPADGQPALPDVLAPIVPDPSPYLYYYGLAVGPDARSTRIKSNYIGMSPGSIINQVNLQVPSPQLNGGLVFQLVKIYNCGFFFTLGCGRGFMTVAASLPVKIPVAR